MERLASDILAYIVDTHSKDSHLIPNTFDLGSNFIDVFSDKIKLRIQPLRNNTAYESVQNSGAMARVIHTQANPPLE
jgi:hypothetical protein